MDGAAKNLTIRRAPVVPPPGAAGVRTANRAIGSRPNIELRIIAVTVVRRGLHLLTDARIARTFINLHTEFGEFAILTLIHRVHGAGSLIFQSCRAKIHIVRVFLFKEGQERNAPHGKPTPQTGGAVPIIAHNCRRRHRAVHVGVVLYRERELAKLIGALHTPRRFSRRLNCGKKKSDQYADDGDYDQ